MEKTNKLTTKKLIIILAAIFVACGCILGGLIWARNSLKRVATEDTYEYVKPDPTKADTDTGFKIDGVLDEAQYQKNKWLYMSNTEDGADVDIAMTSYFGEKGMYIVYDVTERTPIYVNLDRGSTLNSSIEMYLAPSSVTNLQSNNVFEIDLMPTGDMIFKKTNGKGTYTNVATTDDTMAVLGATTKGGEVNTKECEGYCLELFIPWDYMEWLDIDSSEIKENFVYVNPAHITSFNYEGTSNSTDRYWYHFAQQQGAGFSAVYQYFRFDENGVQGTESATLTEGEHYSIKGADEVIPGMLTTFKITPEKGHALNSIIVNGEEYIKKVSFDEDGSAILKIRGAKEGLKISAATEEITDGNKTLSGTLTVVKGNLQGVSASYKGPRGEQALEIDGKGKFVLTDLPQGFYTITIEKEGYEKLVRSIYVNRNVDTELVLDYPTFEKVSGANWIMDYHNEGKLYRFGGNGVILTKDSYKKFTFESNFRYDKELAKENENDYFVQQRQGMRIAFSNEKVWHINLINADGKNIVQYGKHTGDKSLFKWKTVHELSESESAKYTSEDGIKLSVQRDGKYANVYLDGKLIAVEILDDEYTKHTAKLGFEGWVANRELWEYSYKITNSTSVNLKNTYFKTTKGWDVSGQYNGWISLPEGGRGNISFIDKYVNMDLTLTVRDYQNSTDKEGTYPRNDVLFVFDNGAHVSFSVVSDEKGAFIQSMNNGANNGLQIYNRWKSWGKLTEEESTQYKNEGVDFRIVRIGTEVTLYIGDRMVAVADLTNNNRGVTADMEAKVTIRHYDDAGVEVKIPFKMTESLNTVKITSVEDKYGKVVTAKENYVVGDTVVLSGAGKEGYYCYAMTVDGKPVKLDELKGTYTFTATNKEYTIAGSFAEKVFEDNNGWNLLQQKDSVVSLPNGGNGGRLQFYKQYVNMDLTVKAKDDQNSTDKEGAYPRTDVLFVFENGKNVSFSTSDTGKETIVQCLNYGEDSAHIYKKYKYWDSLTEEEVAQYKADGVDFRVVRIGTDIHLYIGDRKIAVCDLTGNNSGVNADTKATVYLRHYDDAGVQVDIPFSISESVPKAVKINIDETIANGTFVTQIDKEKYLQGDNVVFTAKGDKGYYYNHIELDGVSVVLGSDGYQTFKAEKDVHNITGSFAPAIFDDHGNFVLTNQNVGLLATNVASNTGYIATKGNYNELTLTAKAPESGNFGLGGQFYFELGETDKWVTFRIHNEGHNNEYYIQCASGSAIYKNNIYYKLTAEEITQLKSKEGIEFKAVRKGATLEFYLGGKQVKDILVNGASVGSSLDLTKDISGKATGITAETTSSVKIQRWFVGGSLVEIPFSLSDEVDVVVSSNIQNGTVKTDKQKYVMGDQVVITVTGENGYYYDSLKINGKEVVLDWNGTYTFTAMASDYEIKANFAPGIFTDHSNFNLINQNVGLLATSVSSNTGYIATKGNYNELTLIAKAPESGNFGLGGQFYFELGETDKWVTFRIHNEGHNDEYYIQCASGSAIYKNNIYYKLTAEEIAQLKSEEGIVFKAARKGAALEFYLGGKQVKDILVNGTSVGSSLDLTKDISGKATGITAETTSSVKIQRWYVGGSLVEIPFSLSDTVNVVIADNIQNGTVTTDKTKYELGEEVVLTVKGDSGYYYDSLKINGEEVQLNWDGTYKFTATASEYEITASFSQKTFNDHSNFNLINQNVGLLATSVGTHTGWIETVNNCAVLSLTAKAPESGNFGLGGQFYFELGNSDKWVTFRIHNEGHNDEYYIQCASGSAIYKNNIYYKLTADEIAQLKSEEGIEFKAVRTGTNLEFYLGGKQVKDILVNGNSVGSSLDLTKDISGKATGITAETTATAKVQRWYVGGKLVEIPFGVVKEAEPVVVNINNKTGKGSVTTDKNSYVIGEKIVVTVAGEKGYYYNSLKINGKEVILDWNGTYTFTATETIYTIEASFVSATFADHTSFNLINQNVGLLATNVSSNTGYISTKGNYKEFTLIAKAPANGNFGLGGQFYFELGNNDKWVTFRIHNEGHSNEYYIQCASGTAIYKNNIYYKLTTDEIAQLKSKEGIEFKAVRKGTTLEFYLGGNQIKDILVNGSSVGSSLDLTKDISGKATGITAETTSTVKIQRWFVGGSLVEIPFKLK